LPFPFFPAARRRASASAPPPAASCGLRGADDVIDARGNVARLALCRTLALGAGFVVETQR